jgi:hypothetical protein
MMNEKALPLAVASPVMAVASPQFVDYRVAMRGMRQGGRYEQEQYCGVASLVIGVLIFPCM